MIYQLILRPGILSRSPIIILVNETLVSFFRRLDNMNFLQQKLKEIDGVLNLIRNHGRQAYLNKESFGFSRIQHDYTDARAGFMKWKGMLEERLV